MEKLKCLFFAFILCFPEIFFASESAPYTLIDMGTLETDGSIAKSLNNDGNVAGKFFINKQASDFIWNKKTGLQVIAENSNKNMLPQINDSGQVACIAYDPNASFWSTCTDCVFLYDPKDGLKKLGEPNNFINRFSTWNRRDDINIVGMDNRGLILFANNKDMFKSTKFAIWSNKDLISLTNREFITLYHTALGRNMQEDAYFVAFNNNLDFLVTKHDTFILPCLRTNLLQVLNLQTKKDFLLPEGKSYFGVGINDKQQVIGRHKKKKEGAFWPSKTELVILDHFIPVALNNHGDIVGKIIDPQNKNKHTVSLRKADGTVIDLNSAINSDAVTNFESLVDVTGINDEGQIIVIAKVSGKEHVLFLDPVASQNQQ